jgi:charged multivesicular body protein 6
VGGGAGVQTNNLEFTAIEDQVLEGLRMGTDVLRALNNETRLEEVERLREETEEAYAYQAVRACVRQR